MDVKKADGFLLRTINLLLLVLAFLLPLLVSTRSSEVFELPKMLFVYAATAVIVGLWLMRMAVRREVLIARTPLDIPILLFLISQMVSTIYSVNPHVSWWGWYGRFHGGLISTISYTLLYYAMVSNLSEHSENSESQRFGKSDNQKTRTSGLPNLRFSEFSGSRSIPSVLIFAILASAAVVSGYAILQHFGIDKNFWVQDVVNRVFSTQGQPNWLAAYLVMTIPFLWAAAISDFRFQISDLKKMFLNLNSYILILIFILALLWTKSRSGLIGLAVADAVFWSLVLFKSSSRVSNSESRDPAKRLKYLYRYARFLGSSRRASGLARNDVLHFLLIHVMIAILILATNNPAREYIFQKSQLISAKISLNQMADKSDKSASGMSDLSIVRFLADFSRDSDFSGTGLRKSEQGGTESGDIRRIVWNGAVQLVKQRPIFGFGPETFGETYWRVRPKEHNLTSEWNFLYNKAHNEWLNLAANTGIFGLGSHILILIWFNVWSIKRTLLGVRQGESLINTAILAGLIGVEAVNFFGFSTVTIGTYRYLFMAAAISAAGDTNKLLKPIADREATSVIQNRDREENLRKNMDLRQKFILAGLSVLILYLISQVPIFFLADLAYNRGRAYQDGGYIEEAVEPLIQAVNLVPGEPVFRAELGEAEGIMASQVQSSKFKVQSEDQTLINELRNEAIKNLEIVRKQSPQNLGFVRTEARILFLLGEQDRAVSLMKAAMSLAPTNPQLPYSLGQMLSKMGNEEEAAVFYNKAVELKPDYAEAWKQL